MRLVSIPGDGTPAERTHKLTEAIREVIYEHGEGMTIASILGVLTALQFEVWAEQER